jgi:hypothetical protein
LPEHRRNRLVDALQNAAVDGDADESRHDRLRGGLDIRRTVETRASEGTFGQNVSLV